MVDILNPRCRCGQLYPVYGVSGQKRDLLCSQCKTDGMVNVVSSMCQCGRARPTFGLPSDGRCVCCIVCKDDAMIDVTNPMCICGKRAAFGLITETRPTRCNDCKSEEMANIVSKQCIGPCGGVLVRPGQQYCANCDTQRKRKSRVRENQLANYIRDHISVAWSSWNKQPPGARECGKGYRPDFIWVLDHLIIVLECDEDQHITYECERRRMNDLWNTYGGMPIVFIPFNPDAFKIDDTTRRVPKDVRHKRAVDVVEQELARSFDDVAALSTVRVTYMFFDTTDDTFERRCSVTPESLSKAEWCEMPL